MARTRRIVGLASVAAVLVVGLGTCSHAPPTPGEPTVGGEQSGWDIGEAAQWDGNVLRFSGPGHAVGTALGHPADLDVQFRYLAADAVGEVVLRASQEPPRTTELAVHLGPDEVVLLRRRDGVEEPLAATGPGLEPGSTHRVRIVLAGGAHRIWVDDELRLSVDDVALPAGGIAFGCIAGGGIAFADIVLEPPNEAERPRRAEPASGLVDLPLLEVSSLPAEPTLAAVSVPPTVPPTALQRAYRWKRTGGPLGGLGYDIRLTREPEGSHHKDTMFVTDAWAGVFRRVSSYRAPGAWVPAVDGITVRTGATREVIPVFSLTVDPHDANVAWAGAKEMRGIFRTEDRGKHWAKMDAGVKEDRGITFRGFTVHPSDPRVVYAAAELRPPAWIHPSDKTTPRIGKLFDRTLGVVYRTKAEGGARAPIEWVEVWRGDCLARYVWIDPSEPERMYISTGIFDREAGTSSKTNPGGVGVMRSLDGGKTWNPANAGLDNLFIGSLFMHPDEPKTLVAAAGNIAWNEGGGVYRSTNGGTSWTRTLSTPDESEIFTAVELAVHPQEKVTIAYAGSQRAVYRSENGGLDWDKVTQGTSWGPPGVLAGWPIDFQADPDDPFRLFANAYGGGAFVSTDGGETWSDASQGYTGAQVRALAVHPVSGTVHAGGRSGIFYSIDHGGNWKGMVYPPAVSLDWPVVAVDPHAPHELLGASMWGKGPLVQRRAGHRGWKLVAEIASWVGGPHGLAPAGTRVGWRGVAFAPQPESRRVYVGTAGIAPHGRFNDDLRGIGVFRSDDRGRTFEPANDKLSVDAHVRDLAVHGADEDLVWAATTNHGLLRSGDGGLHWASESVHPERAGFAAISVAVDPTGALFVGHRRGGLFRRATPSDPWVEVKGISGTASITDIIVDPSDAQVMYAADQLSGVYRSDDRGKSWMPISVGLDIHEINALAISSDGSTVYAGSEGTGVYRLDVPP